MFSNYLKATVRHLWRQKGYALINILGLAIGFSFCCMSYLFVKEEWSFDAFHHNADRIFRVYTKDRDGASGITSAPIGPALSTAFSNVTSVRFSGGNATFLHGEGSFRRRVGFVDAKFLDVFTFPILAGDQGSPLLEAYSVVLTEEFANQLFGTTDIIGKSVTIEHRRETENYLVTAVMGDAPKNSSIRFDALLPFERSRHPNQKSGSYLTTYVMLPKGMLSESLETLFPPLAKSLWKDEQRKELKLQSLRDMHHDTEISGNIPVRSPGYAFVLSGIGLLIILVGTVNFATLALAQVGTRFREAGLRKVLGAHWTHIFRLLLGETLLLSLLALIAGLCLAEFFLPTFNELTGKALDLSDGLDVASVIFAIGFVFIFALAAGSIPALALARCNPAVALEMRLRFGRTSWSGRGLVSFQLTLSVFMVIGAVTVGRQLDFVRTKSLGFNHDQVVVVNASGHGYVHRLQIDRFRSEVLGHEAVMSVGGLSHYLNNRMSSWVHIAHEGEEIRVEAVSVDYDLMKTMGMELVEGRYFSRDVSTDVKEAVIVNEAFVKRFGWEVPLGKTFRGLSVIGVVGNFHFRSLHHEISPALLRLNPGLYSRLLLRIQPENVPGTMAFLKATWERMAPEKPFQCSFLDDEVDNQYRDEEKWSKIVRLGAGFAVFIACMGAFGLTALSVSRRSKEIGIRKVLGCSAIGVSWLFTQQAVAQLVVANGVAWFGGYYAMDRWLENFAYRINLGSDLFLMSGGLTLFVVLVTVVFQASRAAMSNPVDALR